MVRQVDGGGARDDASPRAAALMWIRGIHDGETGADAPSDMEDDELIAIYITARGIGTRRSGRVTVVERAPFITYVRPEPEPEVVTKVVFDQGAIIQQKAS